MDVMVRRRAAYVVFNANKKWIMRMHTIYTYLSHMDKVSTIFGST